jgi:hypothetical protein
MSQAVGFARGRLGVAEPEALCPGFTQRPATRDQANRARSHGADRRNNARASDGRGAARDHDGGRRCVRLGHLRTIRRPRLRLGDLGYRRRGRDRPRGERGKRRTHQAPWLCVAGPHARAGFPTNGRRPRRQVQPVRFAHDRVFGDPETTTDFSRRVTLDPECAETRHRLVVPVHIWGSPRSALQDTVSRRGSCLNHHRWHGHINLWVTQARPQDVVAEIRTASPCAACRGLPSLR